MTNTVNKNKYKESQELARSPSVVLTTEDLLKDEFLDHRWATSKYVKDEVSPVLTNKDLDSYDFLEVPSVIPENAYPREVEEKPAEKPVEKAKDLEYDSIIQEALSRPFIEKNYSKDAWTSKYGVTDLRVGKESYSSADKRWENKETVRLERDYTQIPKSKSLFQRIFAWAF